VSSENQDNQEKVTTVTTTHKIKITDVILSSHQSNIFDIGGFVNTVVEPSGYPYFEWNGWVYDANDMLFRQLVRYEELL